MSGVSGHCADEFAGVRECFENLIASGDELGASLCVTVDGEAVADLWGGCADPGRTRPWREDTLVNVFSLTKTMTALCVLLLAERGALELDRPVAAYWPEFAAAGKGGIEIRHLLAHTSGVSGWDRPIELADIYDAEAAEDRLARQAPWWEPGTASGYHALNYGQLLGAVVRRVTGRSLGRFFAEELAGPLGADFHIGLAPADHDRVATLVPPELPSLDLAALDQDTVLVKTLTSPLLDLAETASPAWRSAEIGAVNGHGNARSVARVQSVVSCGGTLGGRTFLSPPVLRRVFDQQSDGVDLALLTPLRFGIGYGLAHPQTTPYLPEGRVCWWAGYGGSIVVNDLDRRMTVAYTMNRMAPGLVGSDRSTAYVRAAYAALGVRV